MPSRIWVPPTDVARHIKSNRKKREQICKDLDDNGFDWLIWAVAGSGFLTDSYNLFSTNVILTSLAFVYWNDDKLPDHETAINAITLTGSLLGQLIFGFLTDRFGRKRLYGVELIIVIFGTIGFVQSSAGYDFSMSILGWIMFWRFFVGLGIGAEYPLSAVITAEFAPRQSRARMMAAVFLMQPLGQLLASVVGLAVLFTIGRNEGLADQTAQDAKRTVDRIWRYVIGVGAIPALIAILFRLTIPESPRYTLDVDHDGARALDDTENYLRSKIASTTSGGFRRHESNSYGDVENSAINAHRGEELIQQPPRAAPAPDSYPEEADDDSMEIIDIGGEEVADGEHAEGENPELADPFSRSELVDFFITQGNIKYLMGTSFSWFLLDFAFYGLGINNPRVIAQIWSSQPVTNTTILNGGSDIWMNPTDNSTAIYETLKQDGIRSIITISVGSVFGSLIIIKLIDYVPRKAWLAWSFIGMAILFAVAGGSYTVAANSDLHALTIVFYVLSQLLFNLGPNTLTFIIPAEIFPTRYRGTCHGISAASGKLGSIIVQAFLPSIPLNNPNSISLAWVLIGFSFAMALGAVFAWAWIPEVQRPRGSDSETEGRRGGNNRRRTRIKRMYEVPSMSLEELALGKAGVKDEALQVGFGVRRQRLVSGIQRAVKMRGTVG